MVTFLLYSPGPEARLEWYVAKVDSHNFAVHKHGGHGDAFVTIEPNRSAWSGLGASHKATREVTVYLVIIQYSTKISLDKSFTQCSYFALAQKFNFAHSASCSPGSSGWSSR